MKIHVGYIILLFTVYSLEQYTFLLIKSMFDKVCPALVGEVTLSTMNKLSRRIAMIVHYIHPLGDTLEPMVEETMQSANLLIGSNQGSVFCARTL